MPGILSWPFRIILYVMLYIVWLLIALLILAAFPSMTGLEGANVLPAGWILIAGVFFTDIYFTQLRGRRR
jgi:hypothetical protein